MATPSVFSDLGQPQLHYLKSQYLASLQMVDQTETALKAQLEGVGKARKQLEELMQQLDHQLAGSTPPEQPVTPAKPAKPASRPTTRSRRSPTS